MQLGAESMTSSITSTYNSTRRFTDSVCRVCDAGANRASNRRHLLVARSYFALVSTRSPAIAR